MTFNCNNKQQTKNSVGKTNFFLAVDIGTEYVKAVVYKLDGGSVDVIGYSRVKQQESAMYAAFILNLQHVIDTVDKGIGEAVSMALDAEGDAFVLPKKVIFGIAGELVYGVTIMVNVERDTPDSPITESEVAEFVDKVKKYTFSNTIEEIAEEMGIKASQVQEVSTSINSVYIDGMKVNNPLNFTGSELIYRVYSTFAPKIHIESINQVAAKLNFSGSQIVVEPYALAMGLKNMREPNTSAIIIDIGGGTTDVALVQNGEIVGTKMFAIGGRVFTKRVQKELGMDYEEAE